MVANSSWLGKWVAIFVVFLLKLLWQVNARDGFLLKKVSTPCKSPQQITLCQNQYSSCCRTRVEIYLFLTFIKIQTKSPNFCVVRHFKGFISMPHGCSCLKSDSWPLIYIFLFLIHCTSYRFRNFVDYFAAVEYIHILSFSLIKNGNVRREIYMKINFA